MIKIYINRPAETIDIINEAINTNLWKKNIDAIEHSRSLVLEKYQFFPFISSLIRQQPEYTQKRVNHLRALPYNYPPTMIEKLKRPLSLLKGLKSE